MTNDQRLNAIKELVSIESTAQNPRNLRRAYDFMVEFLLNSGKEITIEQFESDGKPSLLAYSGTQRPEKFHLILNGHLDVVPGKVWQFQPELRDGKLYGRGVHDMKAACVVMAELFCEYVDKVPFALGLQIVTDEESAGKNGTLYQVQQGVRSDFVICGECGRVPGTFEIANRAKGIIIAEIGFRGTSAHGAYPWTGDNAALRANRFISILEERYPTPAAATSESTIAVISISADSGANTTIPDRAMVKLNCRFVPGDPVLSDEQKFSKFISELDSNAEIVAFHDFSFPLYSAPENPQLVSLKAAAEAVEGHEFQLVQRNGTSDGRFYSEVGNEACEFGIVGENQHGDDEYITLAALENFRATLGSFLDRETNSNTPAPNKDANLAPVAVS